MIFSNNGEWIVLYLCAFCNLSSKHSTNTLELLWIGSLIIETGVTCKSGRETFSIHISSCVLHSSFFFIRHSYPSP
ncbi:hypothetical protein EYC84_006588 [Monilinia fructicola]|uniref:Uncharacterized protein n=1 Tax=Monilinia fructicola TaxID=38448 RepID=A0A5M9K3X1_MONFR|nr:hypothetical protein EYC84_006588 [Monilinia fructicola]